jgi:hypothetical protein
MKWLPILLALCGFNAAQVYQLSAIIENFWLAGSLFLDRGR